MKNCSQSRKNNCKWKFWPQYCILSVHSLSSSYSLLQLLIVLFYPTADSLKNQKLPLVKTLEKISRIVNCECEHFKNDPSCDSFRNEKKRQRRKKKTINHSNKTNSSRAETPMKNFKYWEFYKKLENFPDVTMILFSDLHLTTLV